MGDFRGHFTVSSFYCTFFLGGKWDTLSFHIFSTYLVGHGSYWGSNIHFSLPQKLHLLTKEVDWHLCTRGKGQFWKFPWEKMSLLAYWFCCTIIHVHVFFCISTCRRCLCSNCGKLLLIFCIYNIFTILQVFIRILYGDHPSVVCSFVIWTIHLAMFGHAWEQTAVPLSAQSLSDNGKTW